MAGGVACCSARALVADPDLLLLDEPTNHLDIDAIAWLEDFLADYRGAVVFVTHDRAFLRRLATRIVELDRGRLRSWPGDYPTFLRKKEEWLANEAIQQAKFDKRLAQEEAWLRQGVKARRTRNEGRVRALMAMREAQAARRAQVGAVRLQVEQADPSGQMVFEVDGVSKAFDGQAVLRNFSTRVIRGDRIGLIGPNGVGKTTLLRLLLGTLPPDGGEVRQGANVQVAYYDQQREQLDPERSVFETVGDGNETVTVNGRPRHVLGYLGDFLFPPERARSPVKALSGGERNRLLLARLFTRPANVLVLDEPTNDLDLETLELLEAQLVEWPGTLLLVSHDRVFLDNVVTSTLVFEGDASVQDYVGGYEDWLRQRSTRAEAGDSRGGEGASTERRARQEQSAVSLAPGTGLPRRLTWNEQRELERLPSRIDALEAEERHLHAVVAGPEFYKERRDVIATTLARIDQVKEELLDAYARWDEPRFAAPMRREALPARQGPQYRPGLLDERAEILRLGAFSGAVDPHVPRFHFDGPSLFLFEERAHFHGERRTDGGFVRPAQQVTGREDRARLEIDVLIPEQLADLVEDVLGRKDEIRQPAAASDIERDRLIPRVRVLPAPGRVLVIEDPDLVTSRAAAHDVFQLPRMTMAVERKVAERPELIQVALGLEAQSHGDACLLKRVGARPVGPSTDDDERDDEGDDREHDQDDDLHLHLPPPWAPRRSRKAASALSHVQFRRLCRRRRDPLDHRGTESLVLHPVQPGDRAPARRRHLVDLGFRMTGHGQ